jgi:hypothetical protein
VETSQEVSFLEDVHTSFPPIEEAEDGVIVEGWEVEDERG